MSGQYFNLLIRGCYRPSSVDIVLIQVLLLFIMDFLKSLCYPEEAISLLQYRFGWCEAIIPKCDLNETSATMRECYEYLNKTSRSFAAVIMALEDDLRNSVCIFYLVLRALDTIEDDMTIAKETKLPLLKNFYKKLNEPEWRFIESQEKDRIVLENFPTISYEFRQLKKEYQYVISDICSRMGNGMCHIIERSVDTIQDWNRYCHYVAGLVGIGLSKLFVVSGLEDPIVSQDEQLANSMGLFLQKTNIIRDYLEDITQGRQFWPKEVWKKYCGTLSELSAADKSCEALQCLNELITNAMKHIPDVIEYMSRIQNQSVFNFCAIPQVMAISTLERCYNNPNVFSQVVKIRKGEAVQLTIQATDLANVKKILNKFVKKIQIRIPVDDPSDQNTFDACSAALEICQSEDSIHSNFYFPLYVSLAIMISAILWNYWSNLNTVYGYY